MSTNGCTVSFFDAGEGFISGVHAAATGDILESYPEEPDGAVYVRFAEYTPSRSTAEFAIISRFSGTFPPLTLDFTGLGETSGYIKTDGAQTTTSGRSEEHTSELQSLMRISYAVFCLKKKKKIVIQTDITDDTIYK